MIAKESRSSESVVLYLNQSQETETVHKSEVNRYCRETRALSMLNAEPT